MSSQPPPFVPIAQPEHVYEPPKLGFGARVMNVFFSPSETFADINRAAKPFLPLIVVALVVMFGGFAVALRLHPDGAAIARQKIEEALARQGKTMDDIPEQQRGFMEKQIEWSGKFSKFGPIFSGVGEIVLLVFLTLLFWIGSLLLQCKTTFGKILSVLAFSDIAVKLVNKVLDFVGTFIRPAGDIDITEGVIITNLGPLVSVQTNPVVHILLKQFDVFTIWFLILATIGIAAVSRKKTSSQTAVITFGLFGLFLLFRVGWAALTKS